MPSPFGWHIQINNKFLEESDLHLHVPEGATPKVCFVGVTLRELRVTSRSCSFQPKRGNAIKLTRIHPIGRTFRGLYNGDSAS